jgi:hypothetical protein
LRDIDIRLKGIEKNEILKKVIIMRKEAGIEEWKELYDVATKIQQIKPWDFLWDMDLIGIQEGNEEDTVFYSILGRGGECYGIAVYEGYEAFNKYLMLTMKERLNLSAEYVMFNQENLVCYLGNRDELTDKQRSIIKELGYKYRGKNQWMYFLSYEPGFYPFNLNQDEVLRMTEHLKNLELALNKYVKSDLAVDFNNGNMFSLAFDNNKNEWGFGEKPLPFTFYSFGELILTDEELLKSLSAVPRGNMYIEVDVSPMGVSISDKKYDRPANPAMCLLAEAKSEMIIKCEMTEPGIDPIMALAEEIIGLIFAYGAPKEIRVSNVVVAAGLGQICDVCKIKLRSDKRLKVLDDFKMGMKRFM